MATILGLGLDGEAADGPAIRQMVSAFDVVHTSGVSVRGGKIPANGTPLQVNSLGTSQVQLKAGRCIVTANSAGTPPYGLSLDADVNLSVAAADASQVRVDLVIAEVQDVGTSSSLGQFRILQGTPGSGRPALPTTPSTTHCISLATITLPAGGGSTIQSSWITRTQSDTWVKTDSDATWTCAPGGTVLVDFASPNSLFQMTATRRQGFAALFAPGTRWVDTVNRVEGYFDGTDIVPTSERVLFASQVAGPSSTISSTTAVDLISPGAITLIGGTRRIQIHADANTVGVSLAGGANGARFLVTNMTDPTFQVDITGTSSTTSLNSVSAMWTLTASGTIASGTWKLQARQGAANSTTFNVTNYRLVIIDKGPA